MSFNTDQISNPTAAPSGSTVYCRFIRQSDGKFANIDTETLDTYDAADIADYGVIAPEIGTSAVYLITIPTWLPAGNYVGYYYVQAGAGQAVDDQNIGQFLPFYWNGSSAADIGNIPESVWNYPARTLTNTFGIVSRSPVNQDGDIEIIQGDDYGSTTGRFIEFTVKNYAGPAIAGASATLTLQTTADYNAGTAGSGLGPITATSLAMSGADLVIRFEATAAQTGGLESSPAEDPWNYTAQTVITFSTQRRTEFLVAATVKKRVGV
jgi:hypothetical protein